jgi:hypothetical protein
LDVVLIAKLSILRNEVLVTGKYSNLGIQIGKAQDHANATGHYEDEELYC